MASKIRILKFMLEREHYVEDSTNMMASSSWLAAADAEAATELLEQCLRFPAAFPRTEEGRAYVGGNWSPVQPRNKANNS